MLTLIKGVPINIGVSILISNSRLQSKESFYGQKWALHSDKGSLFRDDIILNMYIPATEHQTI